MREESPLTFPCEFPIKVMGLNSGSFASDIFKIANQHIPDLDEDAIISRTSSSAKYLSLTVVFTAQSREQLDAIYRAFNKHPDVKMLL